MVSGLEPSEYAVTMRKATQKMLDHLGLTRHEPSYFRRQPLMRSYYRHVLDGESRARPGCRYGLTGQEKVAPELPVEGRIPLHE